MRHNRIRPLPTLAGDLRCAALQNSSVVAAFAASPSAELLAVNRRFAALLGVSEAELIGGRLSDFLADGGTWGEWRRACLEGAGRRNGTLALRDASGRQVYLEGDIEAVDHGKGGPGYLAGAFVDVSEQRTLRKVVHRTARMEALGSLTSGIAHDFNNLLTVLVGNLYLAAEEVRDRPRAFERLKAARDAAKRGSDLIRQLLAFARREAVDTVAVDPYKLVEGIAPLLGRALGSQIAFETNLHRESGAIQCNAAQLESVLVNLTVNARDAVNARGASSGPGRVSMAVEAADVPARDATLRGIAPGVYFRISVADNGVGIPTALQSRVFEPFFSTKLEQGGTGLGLSMVRWFAEQAGGTVGIESAAGRGTRISLLLPRVDGAAETTSKTMPLSQLPTGDETVLVLSREEGLRSTIQQTLEVLGYTVRASADSEEALRLVHTAAVHVLLVDAAAQHASETERLLRRARRLKPELKLMLAADEAAARRIPSFADTALIGKPFTLADLANAVRRALTSGPRS